MWLHADDQFLYDAVVEQGLMFGLRVERQPPVDAHYSAGTPFLFGRYRVDVHHTPGHCPGGVCLAIGRADGHERELFVGDTLFAGSIGRTDLPGGDHATLINSIHTGTVRVSRRSRRSLRTRSGHDDWEREEDESVPELTVRRSPFPVPRSWFLVLRSPSPVTVPWRFQGRESVWSRPHRPCWPVSGSRKPRFRPQVLAVEPGRGGPWFLPTNLGPCERSGRSLSAYTDRTLRRRWHTQTERLGATDLEAIAAAGMPRCPSSGARCAEAHQPAARPASPHIAWRPHPLQGQDSDLWLLP